MGHGAYVCFTKTFTSNTTSHGTGVDLGRAWAKIALDIPSRSNTTLYLKASADDSTYRRVFAEGSAPALFQIASSSTNAIVPVPGGYKYVKVESQDAIVDGTTFKFICSDE